MSIHINETTSVVNPADRYGVVTLAASTWQAVELPAGTRVITSSGSATVLMQEAETDVVPVAAPDGLGSIMGDVVQIKADTTHLHLYDLSAVATKIYLNYYEG